MDVCILRQDGAAPVGNLGQVPRQAAEVERFLVGPPVERRLGQPLDQGEYPDAGDYMRAAFDLSEGRPLHERYIYPPLLAAACELLVPLGRGGMRTALWIGNVLAASSACAWA